MRKSIILWMIVFIAAIPAETNAASSNELIQLAAVMDAADIEIEEWEVTYKEKVTKQRGLSLLNEFKNTYNLTSKENENSVVYNVENSQSYSNIYENYSVVIPSNKQEKVEIIAKLKGTQWNKTIEQDFVKKHVAIVNSMFTDSVRLYTCLTTAFNDIIDSDNKQAYIMNKLEVENVQVQMDNNENTVLEKIIYGYTNLWEQKINIENESWNFQMAVTRNKLMESQLIIGTPLLINEY